MGAYEVMPDFYQYMKNPNADTNDWDWTIDPTGMQYLLRDIYQRYEIPMIITENGLGARDVLEDGRYMMITVSTTGRSIFRQFTELLSWEWM